jgi:cobalt-zinc-cadmium efflux system protein
MHPVAVNGTIIGITGLVAMACNLGVALALRPSSKQLIVSGAYLHNLVDVLVAVSIIFSGVLIRYTGAAWIDLVLSGGICILIVLSLWPIVRRSVHILLEGAPDYADPRRLEEAILSFPEVVQVHDMHTWMQGDGMAVMTCHVVVHEALPHDQDHVLLDKLREMLREKFGLTHTTLQLEHVSCEQSTHCMWGDEGHAH